MVQNLNQSRLLQNSFKHMANIIHSTQDHLDIADIRKNTVILKNGNAAYVLETNAINFDLLSMMEQDAAIAAYSSLLNSLTFPIQIVIQSQRLDISDYLNKVIELENKQTNKKIKEQLQLYRRFIQEDLVSKENVLDKRFYVVIPYGTFSLSKATPFGWLTSMFGLDSKNTKKTGNIKVDKVLAEAINDLEPKKNFMIKEFKRIGIIARHLNTEDLIKLFYKIYNSETAITQPITANPSDYSTAIVEPKVA